MNSGNDHTIVYKRLFWLRSVFGLSQEDFSEKIEIPIRTYQRIENGTSSMNTSHIFKIAELLGIKPTFFFLTDLREYHVSEVDESNFFGRQHALRKGLFDYQSINDLLKLFEDCFYNFKNTSLDDNRLGVTEISIDKIVVCNDSWKKFLDVDTLIINNIVRDHCSVVALWDSLIRLQGETKYHIVHAQNDLPSIGRVQTVSMIYAKELSYRTPKAMAFNLRVPLDVYIKESELVLLTEKLSQKVDCRINHLKKVM
ncbi:hypothetical protein A9Q84_14285 [Halobacteriovorax marinus]|uniref:HTH cro/C1-type domain-containing protein n=1 Tax=Halobacteriovorax marinus TaxID=97084 RepID=A0A1Y5FB91_9BACT|nr:hypothetical protein A9Q84_14285 [Halobacteriovorax marinus]